MVKREARDQGKFALNVPAAEGSDGDRLSLKSIFFLGAAWGRPSPPTTVWSQQTCMFLTLRHVRGCCNSWTLIPQ